MSKVIRKSLSGESQAPVKMEPRVYISLPNPEDHSFHLMGKVNIFSFHLSLSTVMDSDVYEF